MDHNTFINSCSKRRAFESLRYHSVRPFNVLAGAGKSFSIIALLT